MVNLRIQRWPSVKESHLILGWSQETVLLISRSSWINNRALIPKISMNVLRSLGVRLKSRLNVIKMPTSLKPRKFSIGSGRKMTAKSSIRNFTTGLPFWTKKLCCINKSSTVGRQDSADFPKFRQNKLRKTKSSSNKKERGSRKCTNLRKNSA